MVPRLHNARQTTSTAGEGLLRNERRQHSWRGHTTPVCESSERGGTASCRRPFDGRFIHIHLDKRLNDGLFHWFVSKHVTNVARTAIESAFSAPQLGIRDRYRVVPQPRSPSANTAGKPQRAHTFQARLRTVPWGRRAVASHAVKECPHSAFLSSSRPMGKGGWNGGHRRSAIVPGTFIAPARSSVG